MRKTGDMVWASKPHDRVKGINLSYAATPVIYDYNGSRTALIISAFGLSSMDVATGKQLWFYEFGSSESVIVADPLLFENKVFISSSYGSISMDVLVDITDGKPKLVWKNENLKTEITSAVYLA